MSMEMFSSLVGKTVKINRKGPESVTGKVLNAFADYLIIQSQEGGIDYLRYQHIKSITENSKQALMNSEYQETAEYMTGDSFESLMKNFWYHWVTINRGGHEKVEGIVENINGNYITIVQNEEIIRLPMYHIRGISYGLQPSQPEEKEEMKEKEEKK
ncbi:hypothetical protein QUF73_23490 [Cytobacillus sp. NJ13]|nr:hypothetical protein [Cytobacillus sp. NJ13]